MIIPISKFASIDDARSYYRDKLDAAIDAARGKYFAKGQFIHDELALARQQAEEFEKHHYNGPVPAMVASLAQALNVSPQTATNEIIAAGTLFDQILEATRHTRLIGKAEITVATTTAQARSAYDSAVGALSSLPSPAPL